MSDTLKIRKVIPDNVGPRVVCSLPRESSPTASRTNLATVLFDISLPKNLGMCASLSSRF